LLLKIDFFLSQA